MNKIILFATLLLFLFNNTAIAQICTPDSSVCAVTPDDPLCFVPAHPDTAYVGDSTELIVQFVGHTQFDTVWNGVPLTAILDKLILKDVEHLPDGMQGALYSANPQDTGTHLSPYNGHGPVGCFKFWGVPTETTLPSHDTINFIFTVIGSAFIFEHDTIPVPVKVWYIWPFREKTTTAVAKNFENNVSVYYENGSPYLKGLQNNAKISLINMQGAIYSVPYSAHIVLDEFAPVGLYCLRVQTPEGVYTQKVVINK